MALGGEVTTGADPEIGLGRVELTGPGRLDPVTGPEYGGLSDPSLPCVHWHQDTFTLPGRSRPPGRRRRSSPPGLPLG